MNIIQILGSTLGLGLVSGINLYATVLVVGLGIRLGFVVLRPELVQLQVLSSPVVIAVAGLFFVIEFLADKIKWVDSIWDAVHTFIRPLGAAAIGATALGTTNPEAVVVAMLCGGVALTGHSTKAGVRLLVNHSPEPFSNVVVSLLEDGLVVLGSFVAVQYPYLMLFVVVLFVTGFLWFAPKVSRLLSIEVYGICALFKKLLVSVRRVFSKLRRTPKAQLKDVKFESLRTSITNDEIPVEYLYYLNDKFRLSGQHVTIKCAAGKGVRGLRHAIGYLKITPNEIIFTARRHFRFQHFMIVRSNIEHVHFKKHLLLDRLFIKANAKPQVFYFFKDADKRAELVSKMLAQESVQMSDML